MRVGEFLVNAFERVRFRSAVALPLMTELPEVNELNGLEVPKEFGGDGPP
jgi:hypothetical protein